MGAMGHPPRNSRPSAVWFSKCIGTPGCGKAPANVPKPQSWERAVRSGRTLDLIERVVMPRYVTTMRTAKTPEEAFAHTADLRNFAECDPGVKAVRQVKGSGGGPGNVSTSSSPVWAAT